MRNIKPKKILNGIWGGILAAGTSKRFKGNKLLTSFYNQPLITWVINSALTSRLEKILIILGDQAEIISKIIPKNPRLEIIINHNYKNGIGSSLSLATITAQKQGATFLLILLGDQPLIHPLTIIKVVKLAQNNKIGVATGWTQKIGRTHPIAFNKRYFNKLSKLSNIYYGGRYILKKIKTKSTIITVPEKSIYDIDYCSDIAVAKLAAKSLNFKNQYN